MRSVFRTEVNTQIPCGQRVDALTRYLLKRSVGDDYRAPRGEERCEPKQPRTTVAHTVLKGEEFLLETSTLRGERAPQDQRD